MARLSQEEGVPFDKIAPQVRDGVSVSTLMKHFRDELVPAKAGQKPFGPTADRWRCWRPRECAMVDIASVLRGEINDSVLEPLIGTSKWTSKTYGEPT